MSKKRIRAIPLIALFVLLTLAIISLGLFTFLHYQPVQQIVLRQILKSYNLSEFRISFSKARITLWNPVTVVANEIKVEYGDNTARASIDEITAVFKPSSLFRGPRMPEALNIIGPDVWFRSSRSGETRIKKAVGEMAGLLAGASRIKNLSIRKGTISWDDRGINLSGLEFLLSRLGGGPSFRISAKGNLSIGGKACLIRVKGRLDSQSHNALSFADLELDGLSIPVSWLPGSHDVVPKGGEANVKARLTLKKDELHTNVSIASKNLEFCLRSSLTQKTYNFPSLSLIFSSTYKDGSFVVPEFTLNGSGISLSGSFSTNFNVPSKALKLKITTPFLPYVEFRRIFPDPLVGPWITKKLFPVLSDGKVKVEKFCVEGTTDQLQALNVPANRSCLSLRVVWKDLSALQDEKPFSFRGSSGRLCISNGRLIVSGVKGSYGSSHVTTGSMEIPDLYASKVEARIKVEGKLALAELPELFSSQFVSERVSYILKDVKELSGASSVRLGGRLVGGSSFVFEWGGLKSEVCELNYGSIPITIRDAEVLYRQGLGYRFKGTVEGADSELGIVGRANDNLSDVSLAAQGKGDLGALNGALFHLGYVDIHSSGPSSLSFSLERTPHKVSLQGWVNLGGVMFRAGPVSVHGLEGDKLFVSISKPKDGYINLQDIIWLQDKGFIQGSAQYDVKGGVMKATVFAKQASVNDLQLSRRKAVYHISSGFDCNLKAEIKNWEIRKFFLFGSFNAYGLTVRKGRTITPFRNCPVGITFNGKEISLNCMRVEVAGLPVFISGRLKGWDRITGNIEMGLPELDLRPIIVKNMKVWEAPKTGPVGILPGGSNIRFTVNISRTSFGSMEEGRLEASGVVKRDTVHLEKCTLSFPHIKISAVGYLKKEDKRGYYLSSYVKVNQVPVQDFIHELDEGVPFLEGTLNMEALFTSQGKNLGDFIRRLNGEANFEIKKGKIFKSTVLIKVLDFLSVQKIFAKKPPNLSKGGLYFKEIKGSIEIKDGIATSEQVVMSSPVLNAVARGKLDLNTKKIKVDLGAQPFVTIDSILSKIPLVGYILTGKDRALLVYYFKVRGSWSDPDVEYVPFKNMGKSTLLFLRRAFLTPVRLFKNIRRMIEKLSRMGKPIPATELDSPLH
ncbi:MAG: AsmA-like C-terminal domain-containing protein [Deltaproteobacteria bacterium]|nr:AsmA-like C-terminal domain-containing protein [Deltaproteobacteria bacterium]